MFANRFLLAITPTARLRLDLGAILHHLLQRDQSFLAQRRQHLREQFIEFLLLLHTEIRERVIVHFLPSRQPLERRIVRTAPGRFSLYSHKGVVMTAVGRELLGFIWADPGQSRRATL